MAEYHGITAANDSVYAAWVDMRNPITQPVSPTDVLFGRTHAQEDVLFQEVKAP